MEARETSVGREGFLRQFTEAAVSYPPLGGGTPADLQEWFWKGWVRQFHRIKKSIKKSDWRAHP